MNHPVRLERRNGLATIIIDNPPVNALSHPVRLGILAAFEAAVQDAVITRIILVANGRTFPAGADIKEFGQPARAPSLPDLCDIIEASPKPVIAAIHGHALGGGLELAMAAHYRIAAPGTQLGLPEIKLGLLPGAGGTQRAPRLMPVADALGMMLTGVPLGAKRAEQLGLIDGVAEGDLRETTKMLAAELDQPRPTRALRHRLVDGAAFMSATAQARAGLKEDDLAGRRIVECVEAALLVPFDAALEMEHQAFADCLGSAESAGLRHAFFAERQAQKLPVDHNAVPRALENVAVIGDGLVAKALTLACLNAQLPVALITSDEASVTQALDHIGRFFEIEAEQGRITQEQGAGALSKLTLTTDMSVLKNSDLIIESTGARDPGDVLRQMGEMAKLEAVLCANRADFDAQSLGQMTARPTTTLAMHVFAPFGRLSLAELGLNPSLDQTALATAHHFANRLRYLPICCAGQSGLIGERMLSAYLDAADAFLLKGASAQQVDTAMRAYGMPDGPYGLQDGMSLDRVQAMRTRMREPLLRLPERMVEAGCLGRKVGQGFYIYDAPGQKRINEEVMHLLAAERHERDVAVSSSTTSDIQEVLIAAMANAGAALLEEGIARSPAEIDTVMLRGLAFPRKKGGPMHQANRLGAFRMKNALEHFQAQTQPFCEISPLLAKKAAERESFAG